MYIFNGDPIIYNYVVIISIRKYFFSSSQIEHRLSSSELKRAKAREEVREKQKKRDEHVKKVKVSIITETTLYTCVYMCATYTRLGGDQPQTVQEWRVYLAH